MHIFLFEVFSNTFGHFPSHHFLVSKQVILRKLKIISSYSIFVGVYCNNSKNSKRVTILYLGDNIGTQCDILGATRMRKHEYRGVRKWPWAARPNCFPALETTGVLIRSSSSRGASLQGGLPCEWCWKMQHCALQTCPFSLSSLLPWGAAWPYPSQEAWPCCNP